jgi:hypothetical protein
MYLIINIYRMSMDSGHTFRREELSSSSNQIEVIIKYSQCADSNGVISIPIALLLLLFSICQTYTNI